MYYITINSEKTDELAYHCRHCKYRDNTTISSNICVLNTTIGKGKMHIEHFVNKYTKLDPTLPRIYNLPCPNISCVTNDNKNEEMNKKEKENRSREVIYIRYNDEDLKYLYICCRCDQIWTP
jgi:DNA-directed RNA polymerase subunit M/transcription elongation factor TFIIS